MEQDTNTVVKSNEERFRSVHLSTSSSVCGTLEEIIAEEELGVPLGSPTFERVMRDLSRDFNPYLGSSDSSLNSIPDEKQGKAKLIKNPLASRRISRSNSCNTRKNKAVRFPGRQISQSFREPPSEKVTIQR